MASVVEQTVSTVKRLFLEVFAGSKLNVVDDILTDDFRFQYPFPGFSPGREGIKEFTKAFHTALPGFELEINDLFGAQAGHNEARVAIRWTLRGTHKGNLLGLDPTGKYVTLSAIGIYTGGGGTGGGGVQNQLSVGWLEMDTLGLLQGIDAVRPISEILPGLRSR